MRNFIIIVAAAASVAACGQADPSAVGGSIPGDAARGFMSRAMLDAAESHVGTIVASDGCFDRFEGHPSLDEVMYLVEGDSGRLALVSAFPFFEDEETGAPTEQQLWLFESREQWQESLKFSLDWFDGAGCLNRYTAEDGTVTVEGRRTPS